MHHLLLGEHCSQLLFQCIHLQEEWLLKVWEHQCRHCLNGSFQNLDCLPHLRRQLYWANLDFFAQYIIQGFGQMGKSLDEASVVSCQSTKCPNLGEHLWHWEVLNGTHIGESLPRTHDVQE